MAYIPPHKRVSSNSTSTTSPTPTSLSSSVRSLSVSSPSGGHHRHSRPSNKIIYADGCVFRWSQFPPVSSWSDDEDSLRLDFFPCESVERVTGAMPLVLVPCTPEGSSASGETAAAAIVARFLPELLASAERARTMMKDVPKQEEWKLCLVARVGNIIFQPDASPVSLDCVREAAKAGEDGSRSPIRKTFYMNVTSECFDYMDQSAGKMMGFVSSKQHYRIMVFGKHLSDSVISCKCALQEDGKLANYKVYLQEKRELVEDISCLFKDLDLRLMLRTKRVLKNLDAEEVDAIESLISSVVIDVKGGISWPLGNESIGKSFSIVGVWHTKYKVFMNDTVRLKLRCIDRFDDRGLTRSVINGITFKLMGISKKLQDDDLEADTLKEMLESAVGMIWDNALSYKMTP